MFGVLGWALLAGVLYLIVQNPCATEQMTQQMVALGDAIGRAVYTWLV